MLCQIVVQLRKGVKASCPHENATLTQEKKEEENMV